MNAFDNNSKTLFPSSNSKNEEKQKAINEVKNFIGEQTNYIKDNYKWYSTTFFFFPKYFLFLKKSDLRDYYKQPIKIRMIGIFCVKWIFALSLIGLIVAGYFLQTTNLGNGLLIIASVFFGLSFIYLVFLYPYFSSLFLGYQTLAIAKIGWTKSLFAKREN